MKSKRLKGGFTLYEAHNGALGGGEKLTGGQEAFRPKLQFLGICVDSLYEHCSPAILNQCIGTIGWTSTGEID